MSYSSDIAFTPTVKAIQARKGSRQSYTRLEEAGSWSTRISTELQAFIEAQTSAFLATAKPRGAAVHSAPGRAARLLKGAGRP
jgi:putative heme iron utilization protein